MSVDDGLEQNSTLHCGGVGLAAGTASVATFVVFATGVAATFLERRTCGAPTIASEKRARLLTERRLDSFRSSDRSAPWQRSFGSDETQFLGSYYQTARLWLRCLAPMRSRFRRPSSQIRLVVLAPRGNIPRHVVGIEQRGTA